MPTQAEWLLLLLLLTVTALVVLFVSTQSSDVCIINGIRFAVDGWSGENTGSTESERNTAASACGVVESDVDDDDDAVGGG